jgi:hypothetical protein
LVRACCGFGSWPLAGSPEDDSDLCPWAIKGEAKINKTVGATILKTNMIALRLTNEFIVARNYFSIRNKLRLINEVPNTRNLRLAARRRTLTKLGVYAYSRHVRFPPSTVLAIGWTAITAS